MCQIFSHKLSHKRNFIISKELERSVQNIVSNNYMDWGSTIKILVQYENIINNGNTVNDINPCNAKTCLF